MDLAGHLTDSEERMANDTNNYILPSLAIDHSDSLILAYVHQGHHNQALFFGRPIRPLIDVGNDGQLEWTSPRHFDGSTILNNLSKEFSKYIASNSSQEGVVSVPILVDSHSVGAILLSIVHVRTRVLMLDPTLPDTDGDGVWDGFHDDNRNGVLDGLEEGGEKQSGADPSAKDADPIDSLQADWVDNPDYVQYQVSDESYLRYVDECNAAGDTPHLVRGDFYQGIVVWDEDYVLFWFSGLDGSARYSIEIRYWTKGRVHLAVVDDEILHHRTADAEVGPFEVPRVASEDGEFWLAIFRGGGEDNVAVNWVKLHAGITSYEVLAHDDCNSPSTTPHLKHAYDFYQSTVVYAWDYVSFYYTRLDPTRKYKLAFSYWPNGRQHTATADGYLIHDPFSGREITAVVPAQAYADGEMEVRIEEVGTSNVAVNDVKLLMEVRSKMLFLEDCNSIPGTPHLTHGYIHNNHCKDYLSDPDPRVAFTFSNLDSELSYKVLVFYRTYGDYFVSYADGIQLHSPDVNNWQLHDIPRDATADGSFELVVKNLDSTPEPRVQSMRLYIGTDYRQFSHDDCNSPATTPHLVRGEFYVGWGIVFDHGDLIIFDFSGLSKEIPYRIALRYWTNGREHKATADGYLIHDTSDQKLVVADIPSQAYSSDGSFRLEIQNLGINNAAVDDVLIMVGMSTDSDNDGLVDNDGFGDPEDKLPLNAVDMDLDGTSNYEEYFWNTDIDGDGIPSDTDGDNDGMSDSYEERVGVTIGGWQKAWTPNMRYAILVVGGDHYDDGKGKCGNYDAFWNDITKLYDILHNKYAFSEEDIYLLYSEWRDDKGGIYGVDRSGDSRIDGEAGWGHSQYDILDAIEEVGAKTTRNDFIIFAISSHALGEPPEGVVINDIDNGHRSWLAYSWYLHPAFEENFGDQKEKRYARMLTLIAACYTGRAIDPVHYGPDDNCNTGVEGLDRISIVPAKDNEYAWLWKETLPSDPARDDHYEFLYNDNSDGFLRELDRSGDVSLKEAFDSGVDAALEDDFGPDRSISHPQFDDNGDGFTEENGFTDDGLLLMSTYL